MYRIKSLQWIIIIFYRLNVWSNILTHDIILQFLIIKKLHQLKTVFKMLITVQLIAPWIIHWSLWTTRFFLRYRKKQPENHTNLLGNVCINILFNNYYIFVIYQWYFDKKYFFKIVLSRKNNSSNKPTVNKKISAFNMLSVMWLLFISLSLLFIDTRWFKNCSMPLKY